MDDNKFLSKLSQNLLEILNNDDEYYDITIEVGNDALCMKIFRAHMNILSYRSPYLRRILSANKKKNDGGTLAHIKLPNILPETFQTILRYIYGGKLSLEEYDTLNIFKILAAASELGLQELITYIQFFLIEIKASWMIQNFNLTYQTSFKNDSFLELQNFCTELMSKEPEKIFESLDFVSISEKSLISLIQHDNLQMSQVQVWEHVLKWGIAQNPELSSDPSSYSNDDFNSLKITLHRYIPFIKFFNFTSKEFLNKVYPYKMIIPEDLYENLIKHFLDRDDKAKRDEPKSLLLKKKRIDSNIITFKRTELISKWIDGLEINDPIKKSYDFKLLLRGSRDGFSSSKFHEICDNQPHTVTIVKVKDSNEILGGYNPTEWDPDRNFIYTSDSFIFSFKDGINILSRVKNKCAKNAIGYWADSGPTFGYADLILFRDNFNSYCRKNSYEKGIRDVKDIFLVEEYEVFQII